MPAGVFFYPLSLAALASSSNRDAFCTAGKFAITAQSRPLGQTLPGRGEMSRWRQSGERVAANEVSRRKGYTPGELAARQSRRL